MYVKVEKPNGRVLDLPLVATFKYTNEPQGGPAVTSPPSLVLRINWMLRRNPSLRDNREVVNQTLRKAAIAF